MKSFIVRFVAFTVPLLLVFMSAEILTRMIPNEYAYKRAILDTRKNEIEILFLGSSHAFYGINPEFLQHPGFNAAHVSQSLDLDFQLLEKYFSDTTQLRLVAIPISYFTLFSRLDSGPEKWRAKNYSIYYGIHQDGGLASHFEILGNNSNRLLKRLRKYYLKHDRKGICRCSPLGYGLDFNSSIKNDLESSGIASAHRHRTNTPQLLAANQKTLAEIIGFAKARNIVVLLYTPPAFKTYVSHLDAQQLETTLRIPTELAEQYDNVEYINFMTNSAFIACDFFDADHLNEIGAAKLTHMMSADIEALAYAPETK